MFILTVSKCEVIVIIVGLLVHCFIVYLFIILVDIPCFAYCTFEIIYIICVIMMNL